MFFLFLSQHQVFLSTELSDSLSAGSGIVQTNIPTRIIYLAFLVWFLCSPRSLLNIICLTICLQAQNVFSDELKPLGNVMVVFYTMTNWTDMLIAPQLLGVDKTTPTHWSIPGALASWNSLFFEASEILWAHSCVISVWGSDWGTPCSVSPLAS